MAKAQGKRPLTCLMISGEAERIHMALMLGATAAAIGRPVTYFFSKYATFFLVKEGWTSMKDSRGTAAPDLDASYDAKGVADSALLMDGLGALGARFVVCETAMREHAIDSLDLVISPSVEVGGLADILEKGEGGDWLTF